MNDDVVLEYTFVGDLIADILLPSEMRQCIADEMLRREYFTDETCCAVFDALMNGKGIDDESVRKDIKAVIVKCDKEKQNRIYNANSVGEGVARYNVQRLAENARRQSFANNVGRSLDALRRGEISQEEFAAKIAELNEKCAPPSRDVVEGKTPDDLGQQKPEEEREDGLFRNGFLSKGGSAVLVAETHVGKSVLAFQMAYCWAGGKPAFGIEPLRPLKIAIFQTEDDDDEMREFRDNIKRGLKEIHGWSDNDLKEANDNIRLFPTNGNIGSKFTEHLRRTIRKKGFDLVIINPFQGVFGGDINNNSDLSDFLRDKLDAVINSKDCKCGVLIVHHTSKPPFNTTGKPQKPGPYMGAGGAELSNWARAILALSREKDVNFKLVAVKRGAKLDWPKGDNYETIMIRHAPKDSNLIFWLDGESDQVKGQGKGVNKSASPEQVFESRKQQFAAELTAKAENGTPCSLTEARCLCQKLFRSAHGKKVYDEVMKNLGRYGLVETKTGMHNGAKIELKGT